MATKNAIATLTLIVDYDEELPDDSEIGEVIEAARAYGSVKVATLEVHRGFVRDVKAV